MAAAPSLSETLEAHRRIWEAKPAFREVYTDCYRRLATAAAPGPSLEIGGGIGNLRQFLPELVSVDIQFSPWLDCVADAHQLPFRAASFANVVLFDVLHHLQYPGRFLAEAARLLKPGGRALVLEPAITPLSFPFYNWLHQEPVDMTADPLDPWPGQQRKEDPYLSNQAVPSLLFARGKDYLRQAAPGLRQVSCTHFAFFAYPLSGGFKPWSLLPAGLTRPLLSLERKLEPMLGRLAGFRLLTVLERT